MYKKIKLGLKKCVLWLFKLVSIKQEIKQETKQETKQEKCGLSTRFDLKRIKTLINLTKGKVCEDTSQVDFIKNREAINTYKKWHWKLVGFNKPSEELKKIIDSDLKLDRIKMDIKLLNLLDYANESDIKEITISDNFNNALKNGKEITPKFESELGDSIKAIRNAKNSKKISSKNLTEFLNNSKKLLSEQ